MLPGPYCSGHLATGTFLPEDAPTGTCTYHKAPSTRPSGSDGNGGGTGGTTTPDTGTGDNGGTTTPPAETPPAENTGGETTTPRRRREGRFIPKAS